MMNNTFSYFKYTNEANKLSKTINEELNYINYDDILLDYIYENRNFELAKIIFPLVEDKCVLKRFILFSKHKRWINFATESYLTETTDINEYMSDDLLKWIFNFSIDLIKILVNRGLDIRKFVGIGIIHAIYDQNLEILKLMKENGGDVCQNNNQALKGICISGNFEIFQYLVENGADPNVDDGYALKLAKRYQNEEIVRNGLSGLEIPKGSHI